MSVIIRSFSDLSEVMSDADDPYGPPYFTDQLDFTEAIRSDFIHSLRGRVRV